MAIVISGAPRADITIAGIVLAVAQPFAEGHTLRDNEASVLNQTYSENIRNNFAGKVNDLIYAEAVRQGLIGEKDELTKEARDVALQSMDKASIQAELDKYMESYDFGVRRGGGEPRVTDPVEKEGLRIATEAVRAALKQKNIKVDADKLKELARDAYAKHPQFKAKAEEIVASRKSVGLESLDLGV